MQPISNVPTESVRFVQYWACFYKALMIEGGVPCFWHPRIEAMKRVQPQRFQVVLALPRLEGYQSLMTEMLTPSLNAMLEMQKTEFSWPSYQLVGDYVHEKFFKPVKHLSRSGYSTIHILRYAFEHRIPFQLLGGGIYQLGWGAASHTLHKSTTEKDSLIGAMVSDHKALTANLLRKHGLPAPQHAVAETFEQALQAARKIGFPVVVKPENGNRSEGVTIDIHSPDALKEAFESARSFSNQVLIEEQAKGLCYRLYVFGDALVYANANAPRTIQGDGLSTISQLLEKDAQNQLRQRPWKRNPPISLDRETLECLGQQSLSPDSVPEKNQAVQVRKIDSIGWGSDRQSIKGIIHPDNVQLAVQSAKALHLNTAGVDLIIEDLTRPWHEQAAIINEVNVAPMIGASQTSIDNLPTLFSCLIQGDGRIPVEIYVGQDKALKQARVSQERFAGKGRRAYLTTHHQTWDPDFSVMPMQLKTLFDRCQALLMNRDVEAVIMVIQTDEPSTHGAPVDQADKVIFTGEPIYSSNGNLTPLNQLSFLQETLNLLKPHNNQ
ncbi:MAG: hypothetical protein RI556_12270 [Hydrogenovibrio sp.]|uniref:acetate--CoA ligase family protein n=1 Tax=Hydrogenovibrio sp. TaxID=2065821 RepID=UPI00286FCA87|nr:acetate--CoA ligase family protein [Hydrogenovibrio sp.]MDR9499944.1 hypothetical protein [Hydrogenovibrio sp.]